MNRRAAQAAALLAALACGALPAAGADDGAARWPVSRHLVVDQFGYRPGDAKIAVVRSPVVGYDAAERFEPGARYELRRAVDGAVAWQGTPAAWGGGAVQPSSGDRGWHVDFTAVDGPGRYYLVDVERRVRSPAFEVGAGVYRPVLRAALRTFYYQRSGLAKVQPYAGACWTDRAAFLGPDQDVAARDVTDPDNARTARDLRGGWFDAGDTNKYVTFATPAVHQLLGAWEDDPAAFTDDLGIPESGNGVPDVLDEVAWEMQWLRRMQQADGRVALKVGTLTDEVRSPPGGDRRPRYYVPACTSSTIAAAGMFAHAALAFGRHAELAPLARDLRDRAVRAWDSFRAAPALQEDCDTGLVRTADADWSADTQLDQSVVAATYLFALTGEERYADAVAARFRRTRPYRDIGWSRYEAEQGEALLRFAALPGAPQAVARQLLADKAADAAAGNGVAQWDPAADLYRAFIHDSAYHWGSNQVRANYGNSSVDAARHGAPAAGALRERALGILHYFHGVNPLGTVYLTNMAEAGATRSLTAIYHTWFAAGTRWARAAPGSCGPPPGYLPGGPNASAVANGVPATLSPPAGQPPQKAYRDWNGNWPESSWAVTEPAIYYQAAYVKLLAAFTR